MANLSNINNKFLVTTGGNVLIGQTAAVGSSLLQVTGNSTFAGNVSLPDNAKAIFGTGNDLQLFHNTSNSYIETTSGSAGDLYINSNGSGHDLYLQASDDVFIRPQSSNDGIRVIGGGAVELYHNALKKFETTNTGISVSDTVIGTTARFDTLNNNANSKNIIYRNNSSTNTVVGGGSSPDKIYIQDNGNVGIGTSLPGTKLEVKMNDTASNRLGFTGDGSTTGSAMWTNWQTGNSYLDFRLGGTTDTYTKMRITSDGKVGIGTASPNEKLQVAGNIHAYAPSGIDAGLFASTAAGSTTIAVRSSGITHFNGGNVGIGTTSPIAPLHVVTPAVAGIDLTNISRTANNLVRFTNPEYSTSATMGLLLRVFPDSDARQGAGLLMTGGSDNAASNLSLFVSKDDGTSSNISQSYSALHIAGNTGNVGIGTTSPDSKLDVKGASATPADGNQILSITNTTGGTQLNLGTAENSYGWIEAREGATLRNLLLNPNGGNVGIGTTSPGDKLNVHDSSANANLGIKITRGSQTHGLRLGVNDSHAFLWTTENQDLVFATNDSQRLTIQSGGNIGIGTTSPDITGFGYRTLTVVGGTSAGYAGVLELGSPTTNANGQNLGIIAFMDGSTRNAQIDATRASSTSTSNMHFYTNGGSGIQERMRITSGGDVGIGTSDGPNDVNSKLHVYKNAGDNTVVELLRLDCGENNHNVGKGGSIIWRDINVYTNTASITAQRIGNSGGSTLQFGLRGGEKMRITSGGSLYIGHTSTNPTKGFTVEDTSGATYIQLDHLNGSSTGSSFARFRYNQGQIGSITQNGTSQVLFNTSSDYRLKEDLQDFAGLDMVSKIPVYDFKWKTDESRSYGVMAHELQEVLPQAVSGNKDAEEMQGVDYSKIVPLLVKSIQELEAKIKILENK